ncbi:hypothetical protein LCGC14_1351840 [marine sediment metagenome]|uniref:Uncharacterized protein n=1 Tax=marine sediment metagenome TaxID=412755 RepID=A0A0F9KWR7_9ZZZZ
MVTEAVSDVEVTEAPASDTVVEGSEPEATESLEGAEETEATEEASEPDLLVAIQATLDTLSQTAATKAELQPLQSGIGRINSIQSRLAELAEQNPLAAVDPRIAGIEVALVAILDGQIADPATDDARRTALMQTRQQLDTAGRQRDIDSAVATAVGKALPQETEEKPEATAPALSQADVDAVSDELQRYAARKSVDFKSIDSTVLAFQSTDTSLTQARDRVMDHIDGMAEEAGATDRVTARAAAAGGGTPARSGGASTIDDLLTKLEENGPRALSEAENKRVRDHLGVKAV